MKDWQILHGIKVAAEEGANAAPGTKCPYMTGTDLPKRCAWLAAHYDTHGKQAWSEARL